MTTKERRLTFVYSKLCAIGNALNHCISLLSSDAYDKDLVNDEQVKAIRNELSDVEFQFGKVKSDLERIVDGMTKYEEV